MRFVQVPGATAWFSIWETRVRDYRTFCEATGRTENKPEFGQEELHPVVNVSWEDAWAFCEWLTSKERKEKRLQAKERYRLPADCEWSVAVGLSAEQGKTPEDRMKAQIIWPWGHYWPPLPGDGNYGLELKVDAFTHTSPVGSFKANAFGLYDLGGNVWEWCEDWYNEARVTKVLRGGSFNDALPMYLLAAHRFSGTMNLSNEDIGFRVVLEKLN
ncbi:MAG TPA: SUMF1/EgtB/PvdO family nonheme iron enzyme [Bacillota bacterium]|nr:SUMF1/EgtB/PvdO family nonheme iron enzyme [Bacillota bacterium]